MTSKLHNKLICYKVVEIAGKKITYCRSFPDGDVNKAIRYAIDRKLDNPDFDYGVRWELYSGSKSTSDASAWVWRSDKDMKGL